MKIRHWTLKNGSGMNMVADDMAKAETALGHDSISLSSFDSKEWEQGMQADIHVSHSHVPDPVRKAGGKLVWYGHGTPEHCFKMSVEEATRGGYGHADCQMLVMWWLQNADAIVTSWDRHAWIWSKMCDKHTIVDVVPLGVDKAFWAEGRSQGKFVGAPSVFTCENCHDIKWPLDLATMWQEVWEEMPNAILHIIYLPTDQHRIWFPFLHRMGVTFKAYISNRVFPKPDLRNAFKSVDYVASFVRYGDHNRVCMEAKAAGAKIISWTGNPYADYWIPEGDQRVQLPELIKILKGEVEPRKTLEVPDLLDMGRGMIEIYERILNEP